MENATFFFDTMQNVAEWVQALSNIIGLIPNFLAAFGF